MTSPTYAAETAASYREDPAYHDGSPAPTCPRCKRQFGGELAREDEDDPASPCFDCAMQTLDEGFLADAVKCGIEALAEGLHDYLKSRRESLESAATREQVAIVREALRILRASRDQVAGK